MNNEQCVDEVHADMKKLQLSEYAKNYFSQNGEDGIIEKILELLPSTDKWCVEFGAWDGEFLSNVRYLVTEKQYHAVFIEADSKRYETLKDNYVDNPNVSCINAFVGFGEDDGLDGILQSTACPKNFDFLSIDIDGNDYHVWKTIKLFRPKVVCVEYNPMIPSDVDYVQLPDPLKQVGSGIKAFVRLGQEKGYELVGVTHTNCFFVTQELFGYFDIADNSIATLRENDAPDVRVFSAYSGELIYTRDVFLPWHGLVYKRNEMQVLPRVLRRYAWSYNFIQKGLFLMYKKYRIFKFKLARILLK